MQVCRRPISPGAVGKRGVDLDHNKRQSSRPFIACSRCCEDNVTQQDGHECNTRLCGIKAGGTTMKNVLKFRIFSILYSNEILVFRAQIHKMLFRIAEREYHDQTAFEESV